MATTDIMRIRPDHKPVAGISNVTADAANEASRQMLKNHEEHHVFFNAFGFHNHIAHHILTLYALGAAPAEIKAASEHNSPHQRPRTAGDHSADSDAIDVKTHDGFIKGFGRHEKYIDYLNLFSDEIKAKGTSATLEEYLFSDSERTRAMFSRLNASIIHPIIHLGLATEFGLSGMTAEALAWIAMHPDELGSFNKAVIAKSTGHDPEAGLLDLYLELQTFGPAVREALPFEGFPSNRTDKLVELCNGAITDIVAKYRVTEENVEARIQEAINVEAYITLAAQRRPYLPKADFFLVHGNNGSVYLPAFLKTFGPKKAARLVQAQICACLADYMTVGAPAFDIEWVKSFINNAAKQGGGGEYSSWEEIFAKGCTLPDDGHVVKALRSLRGAEQVVGKQAKFREPLARDDFLGLAAVLLRSVENEPDFASMNGVTNQWVRKAGFEEAWEGLAKVEQQGAID